MMKLKFVENPHNDENDDKSFHWENPAGEIVADITIYAYGLVEYKGGMEVGVERVGQTDEQATVGQLSIHPPR